MIKTKNDLNFYLSQDKKQYNLKINWRIGTLLGLESAHAYNMVRSLRLYEYSLNNQSDLFGRIICRFRWLKFRRLSFKYKIFLSPNTIGYGLRIPHFGGGIIVNCIKMGNFCTVSSGVVIGKKKSDGNRAIIGNNVDFSVGCKIIGKVCIGDNVVVAPNSVVIKDIPADSIVSGIPAAIIKQP